MSLPKLQYRPDTRDSMLIALPMEALQVTSEMAWGIALCQQGRESAEAEAVVKHQFAEQKHAGLSASVHACEIACNIHRWGSSLDGVGDARSPSKSLVVI